MNLRRYHELAHFQTLTSKLQICYYVIQLGRLSKSPVTYATEDHVTYPANFERLLR